MWIVPKAVCESCRCARESEVLTSEWLEQHPEAGLSVMSSGKATLRPYSWRGWKNRPWSRHLFGAATWGTSMRSRGLESWIASLRDIPASPSAPQGSEKVSAILATCGLKSPESSGSADHPSFFSRTSPAIYPSDSMSSAESFKAWATGLRLAYSARRKSERLTAESDCSASQQENAWATPRAAEWKGTGPVGSKSHQYRLDKFYLDAQAAEFQHGLHARPTEQDGSESSPNTRGSHLPSAWPTPTEDNANNAAGPSRVRGAEQGGYQDLTVAAARAEGVSKRLNPLFVEWLMGYPLGWTVTQEADAWEATSQDRMDRLRCLGNAVVPATAQKAFVTLAGELNAGA